LRADKKFAKREILYLRSYFSLCLQGRRGFISFQTTFHNIEKNMLLADASMYGGLASHTTCQHYIPVTAG
jgi:hypothetical protein